MNLEESQSCCGIGELCSIGGNVLTNLKRLYQEMYLGDTNNYWDTEPTPYAILIFTDAVSYGNGTKLASYIKKHKLGKVVQSEAKNNPNHSGNKVMAWLWSVNKTAYTKWYKSL